MATDPTHGFLRLNAEALQARARQIVALTPAAVAPSELDDLEGDAGNQRHADDPREDEPVPGRQADRGEPGRRLPGGRSLQRRMRNERWSVARKGRARPHEEEDTVVGE